MLKSLPDLTRKCKVNPSSTPVCVSQPEAWTSSCPEGSAIIASAPVAFDLQSSAVASPLECRFSQVLFGFESQIRAFAYVLLRNGRTLDFTPMPEMFSAPRSLAAIRRDRLGEMASQPVVHLRFGSARHARVLKGARNVMVTAEVLVRAPFDGSPHPFANGTTLPGPFSSLLAYSNASDSPLKASGEALKVTTLPTAFLLADLHIEASFGSRYSVPSGAMVTDLAARSFAELDPFTGLASSHGRFGTSITDWRRAVAQLRGGDADLLRPPTFIMVPWNLANPASIIPDLVRKLTHHQPLDGAGYFIVIFPYNETPASRSTSSDLIAEVRQIVGAHRKTLSRFFMARMHSLREVHQLRRLFPLAWLDGNDPEVHWVSQRLTHLGVPVALLGEPDEDIPCRFAISPDEHLRIKLSDSFGDCRYSTSSLSVRQLGLLLARSRSEAARGLSAAASEMYVQE